MSVDFQEYFDKSIKSQPINFNDKIWRTLDQIPNFGNIYFLDETLYNSAVLRASKEGLQDPEKEERIIEIYEKEGGEIERFDAANYPVPATLSQIYDLTFRYRQYRIDVTIVAVTLKIFFSFSFAIPYPATDVFPTTSETFPLYTEVNERIKGQYHSGPNLFIDTRLILRKNGLYYPKIWARGNGFRTDGIGEFVSTIPFLGGGIPLYSDIRSTDPNTVSVQGFGSITPVSVNEEGQPFQNERGWSLKKEIEDFLKGDIEKNKLSQLALETVNELDL